MGTRRFHRKAKMCMVRVCVALVLSTACLLVGSCGTGGCGAPSAISGRLSIELTEEAGAWLAVPRRLPPHAAWKHLMRGTRSTDLDNRVRPFLGDKALAFAYKLPPSAKLTGTVALDHADRARLSLTLIGAEEGVLYRAWSAPVDTSDGGALTFSVSIPDHGTWVGGVFTLRGRNVHRARYRVQRLLLEFEQEPPERPNIVLITLDTFRADCVSALSSRAPTTAVLDSLAYAGVLFENAVATSQCTNPSHVSILTGLYCFAHNVYTNHQGVSPNAVTLAEVLKGYGYRTVGAVSARHLNPETSNLGQGFDEFLRSRWEDPGGEPAGVRTVGVLRHLRQRYDDPRPLFAWVHYFDPHTPYSPPKEYEERFPDDRTYRHVRYVAGMGRVAYNQATRLVLDPHGEASRYRGEVAYLDDQVGVLLNGMRRLGLIDNAVVVVVGDHGEGMGEHDVYFQHAGLYEPVIRVPMILCGPEIPKGVRVQERVSTVDIVPTVLDAIGATETPDTYGMTLLPLIAGEETDERDVVFSEAVAMKIRAAWSTDQKVIWVPDHTPKDWTMPERTLCFSLDVDPDEQTNIAEHAQDTVSYLKAAWDDVSGAPLVFFKPFRGHRDAERLRALGYIE